MNSMKTITASVAMLAIATVCAAQQAGDVPIGGVIDWWRPNATFPIPTGYQVADGSTVTDSRSPLAGTALPDLRNKFVRGANDPTVIGQTGGSAQHTHAASPPAITVNSDAHHHLWGETYLTPNGDLQWTSFDGGGTGVLLNYWGNGIGAVGSGYFPLAGARMTKHYYTEYANDRQRVALPTFNTGPAGTEPPFVGLLKIVRIR
jgi:hypothetical protein